MTEILTESFCERCGTRYTFESAAPRKSRLARVRVLSKGVRNFVMSDDASLSEAMADARNEAELAATTFQLDAFHQTFNFCLTCRQYTCGDCWNDADGRCLTCAPLPGQDEPVALIDLAPAVTAATSSANGHDTDLPFDAEAWPEADLPADLAGQPVETPESSAAAGAPAAPEAPDEVGATRHVKGLAPGQSLDEAIAAYEALLAADQAPVAPAAGTPGKPDVDAALRPAPPEVEPALPAVTERASEPVAAEAAAEVVVRAAPDVVAVTADEAEEEPLTVAAELEPSPAAGPRPIEPAPAAPLPAAASASPVAAEPTPAAHDDIHQPTWPTAPAPEAPAQPVMPAPATPAPVPNPPGPWLTVAPDEPGAPPWPVAPQWPAAPQWPSSGERPDAPLTLAGRALLPQAGASALWAASAQEVLGAAPVPLAASPPTPTAQPCISCGLSLSANARFCRRCGSRQG
jgi:hypothetical protein